MNAKEWAEKLNGREYDHEMTKEECQQAEADGVVVVFGASDDLVEFRGAVYDELGAFEGKEVPLSPTTLKPLNNDCDDEDCPYFEAQRKNAVILKAVWSKDGSPPAWRYELPVPHETFEITEDGELYCRGIVYEVRK